MAQYVITYLGGNPPSSPEEGKQHFAKYMAWLKDMGDAVVSPANPLKNTHSITPNGEISAGGQTNMSGYTIINADSIESALTMAKTCPFLEIGGTLEVSEKIEMPLPS